jgi:hypothetical protein
MCLGGCLCSERGRWADARALLDVVSTLAHQAGWDNMAVALRTLQAGCERRLDDWSAYVVAHPDKHDQI